MKMKINIFIFSILIITFIPNTFIFAEKENKPNTLYVTCNDDNPNFDESKSMCEQLVKDCENKIETSKNIETKIRRLEAWDVTNESVSAVIKINEISKFNYFKHTLYVKIARLCKEQIYNLCKKCD